MLEISDQCLSLTHCIQHMALEWLFHCCWQVLEISDQCLSLTVFSTWHWNDCFFVADRCWKLVISVCHLLTVFSSWHWNDCFIVAGRCWEVGWSTVAVTGLKVSVLWMKVTMWFIVCVCCCWWWCCFGGGDEVFVGFFVCLFVSIFFLFSFFSFFVTLSCQYDIFWRPWQSVSCQYQKDLIGCPAHSHIPTVLVSCI